MKSLNLKQGSDNKELINSIDSLFDANFLISNENKILDNNIQNKKPNLFLGEKKITA
ncbi:MAG: hypothetical protein GF383_07810 [Candidatus Lokiarchaeota archaeon]|nr:hypothetical protein [Candidatus Lokiarchaeota archaeon]MBD3340177.1 hypothetical protein [Candidatus Lokiarchaeota archaeon]